MSPPLDGLPRTSKLDAFLMLGRFHIAKGALRDLTFSLLFDITHRGMHLL